MSYIKIFVSLKGKKGNPISQQCKVIVRDGITATSYNDPAYTKTVYDKMTADGKEVSYADDILIEKYPDKKKEAIADFIIDQANLIGDKFKGMIDININRELIK